MSVVMHGESEMSVARRGRCLNGVFAGAEQLHDRKRKIGEMNRIGNLAASEKISKRAGIRRLRQLLAERMRDFEDTRPLFRRAYYSTQRHYVSAFQELGHG